MVGERMVLAALLSCDLKGSSDFSRGPSRSSLDGSKCSPSVASSEEPSNGGSAGGADLDLCKLQYLQSYTCALHSMPSRH